jgi:hypothetical protein
MNNNARDYMLTQLATVATRASLHEEGGTEITGGGYERQAVSWAAASGGSMAKSGTLAFSVPAGAAIATLRLYNTAGDTIYAEIAATETFTNAGTYTMTTLTLDLNK